MHDTVGVTPTNSTRCAAAEVTSDKIDDSQTAGTLLFTDMLVMVIQTED